MVTKRVTPEIYYIISADFNGSINVIYARDNSWYEVNYGINNCTAYYHIVDDKIVNTQFD